jgi:hypothetical protein
MYSLTCKICERIILQFRREIALEKGDFKLGNIIELT